MSEHKDLIVIKPKSQLPMVVEENGIYAYLEQIKRFPVLTEDEEKKLITDFQTKGDLLAAQKLITSHLRLAAKIALTYRRYGLPMSDVISEANLGLMQAVKKFDMDKKVRLATYAIWWIKAAVNDYILRSWSLVKIGTVAAQKKLFYNLSRIKARLGLYENKELEPKVVKAIAHELMVDEKDVTEMNRRIGGDSSLNVSVGDDEDGHEKIDMIVDRRENIEAKISARQEQTYKARILAQCMKKLDEREQYIIKNRMLTENPSTLDDIGTHFNISRERVRQIEKKAFDKLSSEVKKAMAA
ncbi:MAG: RNA polymerase factor sigma-32 [Acetobacter sp. 46_36]|nr:MAG: RNA polymerase factor sigma-32 [Acetobacter sp. 46_36]